VISSQAILSAFINWFTNLYKKLVKYSTVSFFNKSNVLIVVLDLETKNIFECGYVEEYG
jgi:hypothetical protein